MTGLAQRSPLPVDSIGMWEATAGLPEQVAAALEGAGALDLSRLPAGPTVRQVVAVGMGGSGIAGDVLAAVAADRSPVPVSVVKSYDLPASVGPGSLVFAVSCSGDTEETLSAAGQAWERGAAVVAVTGGGELARRAEAAGSPVVGVPASIPQPRAALGAMSVPLLVVMEDLGLLPGAGAEVASALDQLARRRDQLVHPPGPASEVALRIGRTVPLVHGGSGLGAVAAQRWKTQVNENAKSPAFWSAQPELCHNEVAGWGQHGDVTRQVVSLVVLHHRADRPAVARRMAVVAGILEEVVATTIDVEAAGEGDLAQFFDLVLMGDFVSLHLAGHEGVDPGPVPVLSEIKAELARGGPGGRGRD